MLNTIVDPFVILYSYKFSPSPPFIHLSCQKKKSQVSVDTLQKMVSGSEAKMASLQGELKATQASLQTTQQEYESYKVGGSLVF